ncbi:MAG: 3'-5' exonuclease [Christensenella sp.]|uniref:HelD family protein n=1 Tax=Christensenella sp. TaxID=1935934 RepID=UPI002B21A9EC|nr:3'-5' exonuclease [Christensenella sp.]MEA5004349.1 3'-5' exonuclease [Christensenella sp.]
MYRFKDTLCAQNITILSPSKVFSDYISGVLPELGEEPIFEAGFEDVAQAQLEGIIRFEPDKAYGTADKGYAQRAHFKSTLDFVKQLDDFICEIPNFAFTEADYTFEDFIAPATWIRARINAYDGHPLKQRLRMVAEDILERFTTDNVRGEELPKPGVVIKSLNDMLTYKSSLSLYREFYRQIGRQEMLMTPDSKTIEWNDVFPFLYVRAAFDGLRESKIIRHLVIDEMQDYTPIQFAVINRLFPCPKTILGDFSQRVYPHHTHTQEDLLALYEGAQLVRLNKSYRSTYEIIRFAKHIQPADGLEAVERHGEAPRILACGSEEDEIVQLRRLIRSFWAGKNRTLGVITKTDEQAKKLYDDLYDEFDVCLISPDSKNFNNGISIVSVHMSKGLEFDEVIIPGADDAQYHCEHDRSLLYVACTRAMHSLTLLYTGTRSRLLPPA